MILYEKVGDEYVPRLTDEYHNTVGPGVHLVVVSGACSTYFTHIRPDMAPLIAAKSLAKSKIVQAVSDLYSECALQHNTRNDEKEYRTKSLEAWNAYHSILGDDSPIYLNRPSVSEFAGKLIDKLVELTGQ